MSTKKERTKKKQETRALKAKNRIENNKNTFDTTYEDVSLNDNSKVEFSNNDLENDTIDENLFFEELTEKLKYSVNMYSYDAKTEIEKGLENISIDKEKEASQNTEYYNINKSKLSMNFREKKKEIERNSLEARKNIKTLYSDLDKSHITSILKSNIKRCQVQISELDSLQKTFESQFDKDLTNIKSKELKDKNIIDKKYAIKELELERDAYSKQYKLEYEAKANQIIESVKGPKTRLNELEERHKALKKKIKDTEDLIEDRCEEKVKNIKKRNEGNKDFNEVKVIYSKKFLKALQENDGHLSKKESKKLIKNEMKELSKKDKIENDFEVIKKRLTDLKTKGFYEEADEIEKEFIKEREKIALAKKEHQNVVKEYNDKLSELNSSISKKAKDKGVNVASSSKTKAKEFTLDDNVSIKKQVVFKEQKEKNKSKKESNNKFIQFFGKIKESKLFVSIKENIDKKKKSSIEQMIKDSEQEIEKIASKNNSFGLKLQSLTNLNNYDTSTKNDVKTTDEILPENLGYAGER